MPVWSRASSEPVVQNQADHAEACAQRAFEAAGNLGFADAAAIVHGDFDDLQAAAQAEDDHLWQKMRSANGEAIAETFERGAMREAERAAAIAQRRAAEQHLQ